MKSIGIYEFNANVTRIVYIALEFVRALHWWRPQFYIIACISIRKHGEIWLATEIYPSSLLIAWQQ